MSRPSYVCILATPDRKVYLEVTKDPDVALRLDRDRSHLALRLVHQEEFPTIKEALARAQVLEEAGEADIMLTVSASNPEWLDLSRMPVAFGSGPSDEGPSAGGVGARVPRNPQPPLSGENSTTVLS